MRVSRKQKLLILTLLLSLVLMGCAKTKDSADLVDSSKQGITSDVAGNAKDTNTSDTVGASEQEITSDAAGTPEQGITSDAAIAVKGHWEDDKTFMIEVRSLNEMDILTYSLSFEGEQVSMIFSTHMAGELYRSQEIVK